MTLTVEDGTGVSGADSYISLTDARAYAVTRGIALAALDADAEVQLRRGFDYIETFGDRLKGEPVDAAQETTWPRVYVYVNGIELPSDEIPKTIGWAQVHVASAIQNGIDPTPDYTGSAFVTRRKVGPIETEYSESVATGGVPMLRHVSQLMAKFLTSSSIITTERA